MRFNDIRKELIYETYEKNKSKTYNDIKTEIKKTLLKEATYKAPVSVDEQKSLHELFSRPLPAGVAIFIVNDVINDDELNDNIDSYGKDDPSKDCRDIIANWIDINMPHLKPNTFDNENGYFSTIGSIE
jgi:hypothetical protein